MAIVGVAFLFCAGAFLFYRGAALEPAQVARPATTPSVQSTPLATPAATQPRQATIPAPTPPPVIVRATPLPTATPVPTPRQRPAVEQPKEVTVYITRTGAKYHRDGCQYLSRSRIPIPLSEAQAQGYEPCKVCHPPEE
ncbi:MAG TPA: hypothetical protein VF546_23310 [Pyrinomonadaceae bacterium]